MKLLITGANGFLGRAVVADALERGHQVKTVVRPAARVDACAWASDPGVEVVRMDLRAPTGLADALKGMDAVLHLAADKSGSFYAQFASNVRSTEILMDAVAQADVRKLVLISTFSVYDFEAMSVGSTLTEDSPLEDEPDRRDDYCRSKLVQEQTARRMADALGVDLCVIRPGVIYGPGNLWGARLGMGVGAGAWIRTGARARLPMTYVAHCARAIVLAAEREQAVGQTINIVDDHPPTQARYINLLKRYDPRTPRVVPVNYTLMRWLIKLMDTVNRIGFGGRAKLPQIFRPAAFEARCRPLRYANERARSLLGWSVVTPLDEAIRMSFADQAEPAAQAAAAAPEGEPPAATEAA